MYALSESNLIDTVYYLSVKYTTSSCSASLISFCSTKKDTDAFVPDILHSTISAILQSVKNSDMGSLRIRTPVAQPCLRMAHRQELKLSSSHIATEPRPSTLRNLSVKEIRIHPLRPPCSVLVMKVPSLLASVLFCSCLFSSRNLVRAFVPTTLPATILHSASALALRPSQAADLEACAYDLMKASIEKARAESLMTDKRAAACQTTGGSPLLEWCRRRSPRLFGVRRARRLANEVTICEVSDHARPYTFRC